MTPEEILSYAGAKAETRVRELVHNIATELEQDERITPEMMLKVMLGMLAFPLGSVVNMIEMDPDEAVNVLRRAIAYDKRERKETSH